jgi:putative Holliday junction resolvase
VTRGTVLAFDFGLKRTGVAQGELELRVAHPLTVIRAETREARFSAIAALLAEWRPVLLLVGLPLHPDGAEHDMTRAARNFAASLAKRAALPVVMHDERYTSVDAEDALRARGASHAGRRHLDALAAQTLLQGYFDDTPAT